MVLIFWLSVFIHDNCYLNCCSNTNRRSVKLSCYQKIWNEQFSHAVLKNLWKLMNIRKRFKIIPLLSCFIAATEIQLSPYHNIYANVLEKSTSFIDKFCLAWKKNVFRQTEQFGKGCYTHRFATTIFSAIQRCNIVAALFRMVTTLFQHCNAVLC